ncbi:hypothetical protein FRC08_007858 [Ceratobasidium sp. 394]|nr:hypothetical protein FRC08_007858 [Ceratobasidium sp. 394]
MLLLNTYFAPSNVFTLSPPFATTWIPHPLTIFVLRVNALGLVVWIIVRHIRPTVYTLFMRNLARTGAIFSLDVQLMTPDIVTRVSSPGNEWTKESFDRLQVERRCGVDRRGKDLSQV